MKHYDYKTTGTCSQIIHISVDDDDVVREVSFEGGCNGNLQGISSLVVGMKADQVIERLSGIRCGYKNTSCPAELATALLQMKSQEA